MAKARRFARSWPSVQLIRALDLREPLVVVSLHRNTKEPPGCPCGGLSWLYSGLLRSYRRSGACGTCGGGKDASSLGSGALVSTLDGEVRLGQTLLREDG